MLDLRRASIALLVLVLYLCLPPSISEAKAAEPALSLSLEQALTRAEQRAPRVLEALRAVREAEARRTGAGIIMPVNPRANFDLRPAAGDTSFASLGFAGNIEFLFEVGGAPAARVREAGRFADVARADQIVHQRDAWAAAWASYVHIQIGEQRLRDASADEQIVLRVLGATRQRSAAGATGDIDVSMAETEAARSRAATLAAERQLKEANMTLRDLLDLAPTEPLSLSTPLAPPPQVDPPGTLVARALERRPELALIQKQTALLDTAEERLKRETFPRVGGYLGVDAAPLSPVFGVIGVSVELPIAQRNQGPRAQVRAARQNAMELLAFEKRRIAREVTLSASSYESLRAELASLADQALPAAVRALELADAGWRAGRLDVFRVLTAAREVARFHELRLGSLEATWMARIAVARAVGERS